MTFEDLKYRFDELMASVELLPDDPDEIDGIPTFPNLTRNLSETEVYNAVICQSLKGGEEFRIKMCALLTGSARVSIEKAIESDSKPSNDDLYALAITANIMWASGAEELLHILGMIGNFCSHFEVDVPDLVTLLIRPNQRVEKFGQLDPYKVLEGAYTQEDVLAVGED